MKKEDYTINLVLLNEEGRAIELMGCVVKSSSMNINGICQEIEFSVDKHIECFDDDRYYEIIREIRQKKIDNLLK